MLSPYGRRFSPRCAQSQSQNSTRSGSDVVQALEGKDVKDLLLNVGSGGGAAPAAGGAAPAAGGAADAAPAAEEKKEEGMFTTRFLCNKEQRLTHNREGGVGRGHGLRSFRLSSLGAVAASLTPSFPFVLPTLAWICDGISHTRPQGWRLLISGVLVHRRSLLGNLKDALLSNTRNYASSAS